MQLENILLKSPDEDSQIIIADFGLPKIFEGASTLTTICGSPQYVAPEVLEVGQKPLCYTPAADLWSLGVIMYILLSGNTPFDDTNEAVLFQKIKNGLFSMKQPVWETISLEGKDLMRRLLIIVPEKRLTAKKALQHSWFEVMIDEPKQNIPETQGISDDSQKNIDSNEETKKKEVFTTEGGNVMINKSKENLQARHET